MGVKFRLFALFLFLALIAGIESRKSGGRTRIGGNHGGVRRPPPRTHTTRPPPRTHTTRPPPRTHTTRPPPRLHTTHPPAPRVTPQTTPRPHPTQKHRPATEFHERESVHTTNTGNHGRTAHKDPYDGATAPALDHNIQKPSPTEIIHRQKTKSTETKPPSLRGPHVDPTKPPNPHDNRRPVHPSGNQTHPIFGTTSTPGMRQTQNPGVPSGNPGGNHNRQPPFNPYPDNQPPSYPVQHPGNQPPPLYTPYPGHLSAPHPSYPVQHPPSYTQINNYHPLPPNPATTVVVVSDEGSSHGRRTMGDVFTEAVIRAGVNVAVKGLVNRDSFGHRYGHRHNGPPPVPQSNVTSTNTHIVNNNYYGQPSDPNAPAVPQNNNGQPVVAGVPSGTPNTGSYHPGSTGPSGTPGSVAPGGSSSVVPPTNGNSFSNGNNGGNPNNGDLPATPSWSVTDQELKNITEQLFNMDDNNGAKYISLNLQSQFTGNDTNITDASTGPLFTVDPAAYRIPTVKGIRSLYAAIAAVENKTQESSQHEEALFVDLVLNTNVMTVAMDFLSRKNLVKNDYYEHKDILNHIWFKPYEENSSGFKRVFNGELLGEGVFWGLQDWTAFDYQEKANNTNYLSYVNKVVLGKSPPERLILKANYDIRGARKAGTALFVGISPELQMALYTICRFARPDNYCDVSLGGTNVKLFTHTFSYFGKDLIDAAFPVLD